MKKDILVEEFWKWYKTVKTGEWKDLNEDYIFKPKDFLSVGVLLKAVGFDDIMSSLIRRNHVLRKPENFIGAYSDVVLAHERSVICSYYWAYMHMTAHDIMPVYNKQVRMKYVRDTVNEKFYDVYFTEEVNGKGTKNEQIEECYALDYIPWREVMGYQLYYADMIAYDPVLFASEIMWELTFYTYEEIDLEIGAEDEGSNRYIELKEKRDQMYKEYEAFRDGSEGKELTKRIYNYVIHTRMINNNYSEDET